MLGYIGEITVDVLIKQKKKINRKIGFHKIMFNLSINWRDVFLLKFLI